MNARLSLLALLVLLVATTSTSVCQDAKEKAEEKKEYTGPKLYPVAGIVTIDGEPLAGVRINMANSQVACSALSDAEGKWEMKTGHGAFEYDGAPMGEFAVTCVKYDLPNFGGIEEPGPDAPEAKKRVYLLAMQHWMLNQPDASSAIPEKYTSPTKTPIKIEVNEGGNKKVSIELESGIEYPKYDSKKHGPLQITEGTISLDGNSLAGATIAFRKGDISGSAISDEMGRWKLQTNDGRKQIAGAPVGLIRLSVTKPPTVDYGIPKPGKGATKAQHEEYWSKIEKLVTKNGLKQEVPDVYADEEKSPLVLGVQKRATNDNELLLVSEK